MFKKLVEFVLTKECDIFFRWIDKDTDGLLDREKDHIYINIQLMIVCILVHEYIHHVTASDDEEFVKKRTHRIVDRMTVEEIKELCRIILEEAK